jgi:trk system potassium uptake protein TrkA
MHLVIVGAGALGNRLITLAQKERHDVVIIEPDEQRAEECADLHDVRVLNMDVAEEGVADEADLDNAQALVATTGDDSTNLMAMLLGCEYEVETLTSIVNHSSHRRMFERMGVNVLSDPEVLVAQHLLDLTLLPRAADVTTLQDKEQIIEIELAAESPLAGCPIDSKVGGELSERGLYVVSVERNGESFFPSGSTELQAGDQLIVFSRRSLRRSALGIFTGED